MSGPGDVPAEILNRLRPVCLGLPETYEEPAWVGMRWRIRRRTFAHVFSIDPDDERILAHPAAADQPAGQLADELACGLTFRSAGEELDALISTGSPFFKPTWAPDVVGIVLADGTDWDEVAELLTDSYRLLAPKKLATRINWPPPDSP